MAERANRGRCVARPEPEALEGRMLLSGVDNYELSQKYASPQSGEVDFTVTRSSAGANKALKFVVQTLASFDEPLKQGLRGPQPYGPRTIGPIESRSTAGASSPTVTRMIRT